MPQEIKAQENKLQEAKGEEKKQMDKPQLEISPKEEEFLKDMIHEVMQRRPPQPVAKRERTSWVMPLVGFLVLASLIVLNVQLYIMMQAHSEKISSALTSLDKMQYSLDENRDELYLLTNNIKQSDDALSKVRSQVTQANYTVGEIQGKIATLERRSMLDSKSIEQLSEDKRSLTRKIDMLDVEIKQLKSKDRPSYFSSYDSKGSY
ncbi:hypothetical protein ACFL2W_01180 [Candidatus Omnitrophota bacterium]